MKYQHRHHAGNFGDVFKHVALVAMLRRLATKDKAFFFLDTHAGRGLYVLDESARREALHGVLRLATAEPHAEEIRDWLTLVRSCNPGADTAGFSVYPGSPRLAQLVLRPQDRALYCELDRPTAHALAALLGADRRSRIECSDGYQAMQASLPPPERRGLVFVDPAYERQERDLDQALSALRAAVVRWATGVYCLWYPIKRRRTLEGLRDAFERPGWPPTLAVELCVLRDDSRVGLNGAGMLIVNPPWQLDAAMRVWLPELHGLLARDAAARWSLEWLVPAR